MHNEPRMTTADVADLIESGFQAFVRGVSRDGAPIGIADAAVRQWQAGWDAGQGACRTHFRETGSDEFWAQLDEFVAEAQRLRKAMPATRKRSWTVGNAINRFDALVTSVEQSLAARRDGTLSSNGPRCSLSPADGPPSAAARDRARQVDA